MRKKVLSAGLVIMLSVFLMAFMIPQDQKKGGPWEIPAKYEKMENPYADDESLERVAKMLWSKHCKSCHGNVGLGDGPKAKQLETFPGDFSTEEFQAQSDGSMYYRSFIGRDEMPNFEKKITEEEDRWALVNYMRTFAK
jgi:mono/diheme cytochrome c family protein